ncbi:MAG: hypothetical protein HZB51_17005 [Chloroflexi bacterium]|nr:hypothetical protein [Chloroflexota bacterium]
MGLGVRAALRGSDKVYFYAIWGTLIGLVPFLFDWFFLIAQGHLIYGLVGPVLFGVALVASAFLELKIDGAAVISAVIGSAAFLLGILSIPLSLDATKTRTLGIEDYVFGSCFVLMFVVIGGSFAWNGFSAMCRDAIFRGKMLFSPSDGKKHRK